MSRGRDPTQRALIELTRIRIQLCLQADKEKRNWTAVDELLKQLLSDRKLRPDLVVLKAEVMLGEAEMLPDKEKQEQLASVARLLKTCVEKAPKSAETWTALIRLAMYQASKENIPLEKNALWKTAADYIDQAEKNLGNRVVVRLARGSLAIRSKDPQAIEVLKKLGQDIGELSEVEKTQLWGILATLAVQANDLDLAREYCRRVAEKEPKNIRIRYLLCELQLRAYEKDRRVDLHDLDAAVDEIERLGDRNVYWLYGKAIRALVESGKKDPKLLLEAQGYLKEALDKRKDWAPLAVLAGKVCEIQDEPDQALDFYLRAIYAMNERDSDVIGRAAKLLVPRRRIEEAKQLFDYLEKQKSPLLDEMHQDYVFVKVFTGDIQVAEKEVDKSVAADCKNYKDFAWQGEMYAYLTLRLKYLAQKAAAARAEEATKSGVDWKAAAKIGEDWKKDRAMLEMAQKGVNALLRARQLNDQAEEVWISLVRLLVDIGQPEHGHKLIPAIENTLKTERALVTIGVCCELLGESDKAKEKYEAAVKAAPKNSRIARQLAAFYLHSGHSTLAEPVLRNIIAMQSPSALTDACWARRNLAILLRGRGDFDGLCQAKELIEENLRSKALSADDRRLMVQILLTDPRKAKLDDAIAAMEDLVQAPDATINDHFTLAQLYLRKNDYTAYDKRMLFVLGSKGLQPLHITAHVNTLLERKSFEDADHWLQALEKAAPNAFDTVPRPRRLAVPPRRLQGGPRTGHELPR